MPRATKLTYSEIQASLKEFAEASRTHYGTYAHSAGFFESLCASLLAELPAKRQELEFELIRRMKERLVAQ